MSDFDSQGFVQLPGFFSWPQIAEFEEQLAYLFTMQARKIADYRGAVDEMIANEAAPAELVSRVCDIMEERDKQALYQIQKLMPSCQALRWMFDDHFLHECAHLLGVGLHQLLLDGPALFVSRPNSERLLYKFHSEAHYYPRRRRFLNCWMPIFVDRTVENGAMTLVPGSHKQHWDFVEYTGYSKATEGKANHFVQYEIPENHFADFPERHVCETQRGDVVLFHRNLIHRSNGNTSPDYAFAVVARIWDPSEDLTLSGDLAVTPYSGRDIGRADMVVARDV